MKRKKPSEYEIKNELDDMDDVKRGRKRKQKRCPECDNVMKRKVLGKFVFCGVCHRLVGNAPIPTDETPVKEISDL